MGRKCSRSVAGVCRASTTSRTFSRQPFSCWPIRRQPSPGTNRWKAGCAPWPAGWSCMRVPVHGNGKAGNDRSLPWEEPGLRNTAAFCPISIIPSTIPTRKWSAGTFAGYSMPPLASFQRNTALQSYSATSRARPTRRPRDSLDGRRVQCRGACSARSLLRRRLARYGLLIALCAVSAAFAFARVGQLGPRSQPATVSVRQAMQSLRFPSGATMNLESRLQRSLGDGQVSREREQVEALARKAQWVAEQTADQDPGRSSEFWLFHAAKMRLAALDLGQAARIGDRAALLGAARQLDTTCIGCHEIFRH